MVLGSSLLPDEEPLEELVPDCERADTRQHGAKGRTRRERPRSALTAFAASLYHVTASTHETSARDQHG